MTEIKTAEANESFNNDSDLVKYNKKEENEKVIDRKKNE